MKKKSPYDKYLAVCERKISKTRRELEKLMKSVIKEKALQVGEDLINTQYLCYPSIPNYDYSNKKIEQFVDFINTLSGDYKIDLYFEIKEGKFRWL